MSQLVRNKFRELNRSVQVKMAGAAGILIDKLAIDEAILRLRNRRRVQNHIGGIHAAATALLAESATGAVFAMNVSQTIDC
jgi:acyl-coenzyme A thioesterase PaaI-like protein